MKNEKVIFIIAIVVFAGLALLWYGNNRTGDMPVREQLEQAGNNQSNITSGISEAEHRIDNSQKSIIHLEDGISEAGTIIADCKRIIAEVRARNEEKNKQIENAT